MLNNCKKKCSEDENCVGIQFDDKDNCIPVTIDPLTPIFQWGRLPNPEKADPINGVLKTKFSYKNRLNDSSTIFLNEYLLAGDEKYLTNGIKIKKGKVYEINFAPKCVLGSFEFGIYSKDKFILENYKKLTDPKKYYRHQPFSNGDNQDNGEPVIYKIDNFLWIKPRKLYVLYF
jgi:hypothetical protein